MSDLDVRVPGEREEDAPPPRVSVAAEPTDLGFGSVVGGANERRLLNRDGSFTSRREGFSALSYLNGYHALLTMTWGRFLLWVAAFYLVANGFFALLYLAAGPHALAGTADAPMGGAFLRAFFFSIETFATIGYGNIFPVSAAANSLVVVESLCGILAVALLTGLVFARFSRPTAALLFSEVAVVAPYQGRTGFMFRITNARSNQLMELEAKVQFTFLDGSGRRYEQLKLERSRVTFFPLSWTIVHPIDESSPMFGMEPEDFVTHDAEVLILISGVDETFAQLVHARSSYKPSEIRFGARFANIYKPVREDGTIAIDVSRLSEVETAPRDSEHGRPSQTFRHTGLFTGYAPERGPPRRPEP